MASSRLSVVAAQHGDESGRRHVLIRLSDSTAMRVGIRAFRNDGGPLKALAPKRRRADR